MIARRPFNRIALATLVALTGCLPKDRIPSPQRTSTPPLRVPVSHPDPPTSPAGTAPTFGGCQLFPADNAFNTRIDGLAVRSDSATVIARTTSLGANHMQFDVYSDPAYGMYPISVPQSQALVPITYDQYGSDSDPGPFPIPLDAPQEGGGDKHILVVQQGTCQLYELWASHRSTSGWYAGSGAKWDLTKNSSRPAGWTSADAAGLPILPGLLRYDEVAGGTINHSLRFTVENTRQAYIAPASHAAGVADTALFPMGARLRLKASYDISRFSGQSKVIATALKTYGLIVADNGQNWMISGQSDARWNDHDMDQVRAIPASALEYVDTGPVISA